MELDADVDARGWVRSMSAVTGATVAQTRSALATEIRRLLRRPGLLWPDRTREARKGWRVRVRRGDIEVRNAVRHGVLLALRPVIRNRPNPYAGKVKPLIERHWPQIVAAARPRAQAAADRAAARAARG